MIFRGAVVGDGVLGKLPPAGQETAKPLGNAEIEALRKEIGDPTRLEQARAALTGQENGLLQKLGEDYSLSFFAFDGKLKSEGGEEGLERVSLHGGLDLHQQIVAHAIDVRNETVVCAP